ncbi:MAG: enoyl-CoA hydratase/isomerase family protein [Actinomycetia bacterium]|nr:enoyl-CoA hydratase/isomerase family protein [Actinomycetes bacterium]
MITGEGRGFCSGGDMKAMNEARASGALNEVEESMAPMRDQVVLALRDVDKPVIAMVNGPAAGAGTNIALACDIRVASTAASFGQTFVKRGLHPDWGGTYFLPRLIGVARAAELTWSGRMIDAAEALSLGIVSYVTEPEELRVKTMELAASFAAGPPIALRLSRRAIYHSLDTGLREGLEYETFAQNICAGTADAREGIAAFVEKRDPSFEGR